METKQQIGERATHMARALEDAARRLGRPTSGLVHVGHWQLAALPAGEETLYEAEQARRDAESISEPGRGYDYWHARPGLIKFVASDPLAAAWRATGDPAYAQAFRTLLEDYFASLKPPRWAGGGMRLSQRIGRWARFLPYFFDADCFDEPFVQRVIDHVPEQLASILRTHQRESRGNIRLLETDGLLRAGMGLPMLEQAQLALERARWVYADTARRAVFADGSYQEYDPNYHDVFVGAFYTILLWREAFPELQLPDVRETAARVFEYAAVTRSPIGHACGMQESPSPWISDGDCANLLRRRAEVRRLAELPEEPPPLTAVCQVASQVTMRTDWQRDALFAAFDASRWGGAHSHLARNSVLLYAFGRALLPDTGSLTYAMGHKGHEGDNLDHRIGPYGKSTRAHNTLNLNGWNQAPTNPDTLSVFTGPAATAAYSKYSGGYWPGEYGWWFHQGFGAGIHATHERMLFWLPQRGIVVVDRVNRWDETTHGHPQQRHPSLEMNWQLSPGGTIALTPNGFTASYPEGNLLGRFVRLPTGMTFAIHEGETDPPRGWITTRTKARAALRRAGVYDDPKLAEWQHRTYLPAPQLAATAAPMQGFIEPIVSVFLPYQGHAPTFQTELTGPLAAEGPLSMNGCLTLRWDDGAQDLLAWSDGLAEPIIEAEFPAGTLATDGCYAHLTLDAEGTLTHGTTLDASYATWPGAAPDAITLTSHHHGY